MSFASLKKASSTGNTLAKLTQEIEKLNQPQSASSNVDESLWKPELDKSGNGYAVIRFLPAPDGEDLPFAKVWSHAFKGPGGQWYIEKSLSTTQNFGTQVVRVPLNVLKQEHRRENFLTTQTSTLCQIPHTQRMKEEHSFISKARRFLTNLLKQCNLHLLTRKH